MEVYQYPKLGDKIHFQRRYMWTFVTKAYACADGKIVAECEAREKAHFEAWLKGMGWKVESVHDVNFIHEAGQIWKM